MNKGDRAFLLDLQTRPEWQRILEEIGKPDHPRPYKLGDHATDEFHRWLYESGVKRENDRIMTILTLKEDQYE